MARVPEKKFPVDVNDYQLYEEVGEGVSASVYKALCIPLNETVAVKVLDLEKCNNDLDGIRREVHTMSLINHPNVVRAHCTFTTGHKLWIVMPYMAAGSCLHIMKSAYPEGFEEPVIATLLREILRALVYLHAQGHIHRDVKAGNILIDSDGSVKLGDFGVAACMFDTGDRQRSRNTFVGTPCWMAPEVMQQLHGYDFKADIWSFGITAIELAHGQAPFSKYPPMKVLLMILQNAPPGLDYERDKRFSKSFKEMVAACLVKDPKKRPSSEKLLKHHFFKRTRSKEYVSRNVLDGLLPLGDRFRMLKAKEADVIAQNKALKEKEQLSQKEYIRGISEWDFNLEDLKSQAAMIPDDDSSIAEDQSQSEMQMYGLDGADFATEKSSPERIDDSEAALQTEIPDDDSSNAENPSQSRELMDGQNHVGFPTERIDDSKAELHNHVGFPTERTDDSKAEPHTEDELDDVHDLESSLAAFPSKPLQALKGFFDIHEDDITAGGPSGNDSVQIDSELPGEIKLSTKAEDQETARNDSSNSGQSSFMRHSFLEEQKSVLSGSQLQDNIISPKRPIGEGDREHLQPKYPTYRSYSGPLQPRQKKEVHPTPGEDSSEGAVVQRKGRFRVTSADLSLKVPTGCVPSPVSGGFPSPDVQILPSTSVFPSLECLLQQNTLQREEILKMIKYVRMSSGNLVDFADATTNDFSQMSCSSAREIELQNQVIHLQQSVGNLVEELHRQKMKNVQMEKKLNALLHKR